MTLPSTGAISIKDIGDEFNCDYNLEACAEAAGISTTNVKMSNFYGLSATKYYTLGGGKNINLASWLSNLGAPTGTNLIITITGNIGSSSTSNPALSTGDLNKYASVRINLNPNVYIVGAGGSGGGWLDRSPARPEGIHGAKGGTAFNISSSIILQNKGIIGGGGGGGGAGGRLSGFGLDGNPNVILNVLGTGGGGGAGYIVGPGGDTGSSEGTTIAATDGNPGTLTYGGSGGAPIHNRPGVGATGGSLGSNGGHGIPTNFYSSGWGGDQWWVTAGGDGGPAGNAIIGKNNITWSGSPGDVLGPMS